MIFSLPKIGHGRTSFDALTRLHAQAQSCLFDDITVDMKATVWFDADMCAALGAILYNLGDNLKTVNLINIPSGVETIFSKNGFLSHYGREAIPDLWETTISYQRFDVGDDRYFAGYIENEFIHRSEIPKMSPGLSKKFRESMFEIFSNAVLHSRTKLGVFSCGQHFPSRNKLDFTVADLGIGIRRNIEDCMGYRLSAEQAIDWATKGNNTTKRGNVPGGLGLKLLCEFIDLNGGCIRIVSDCGYWQRKNRKNSTAPLIYPFPGTVVSVEINTADTRSYALASELTETDIF